MIGKDDPRLVGDMRSLHAANHPPAGLRQQRTVPPTPLRATPDAATMAPTRGLPGTPFSSARPPATERLRILQPLRVAPGANAVRSVDTAAPSVRAETLAAMPSRRELQKTIRALRLTPLPALVAAQQGVPAAAPDAATLHVLTPASPRTEGEAPAAGPLTRYWQRLPERTNPATVVKQAQDSPLLALLSADLLRQAVSQNQLQVISLGADEQFDLNEGALFVITGQLNWALFSSSELAAEAEFQHSCKEEGQEGADLLFLRGLRRGPLSRAAIQHLLYVQAGEAVGPSAAWDRLLSSIPSEQKLTCYAAVRSLVCWVDGALFFHFLRQANDFAQQVHASLQACLERAQQSRLLRDLELREGLLQAGSLRVVDADSCVHCRECEKACADRHGQARLRIAGPSIGHLMLAEACRTCTDARCVAACGFDALTYDEGRREVVLNESRCVGCSYCQTACPYGAIEMIDLAASPLFVAKLAERGVRARGAHESEVEPHHLVDRRSRVASKCDHCTGYSNQACIDACKHDALFEIRPEQLLRVVRGQPPSGGLQPRSLSDLQETKTPALVAIAARAPASRPNSLLTLPWLISLALTILFYGTALLSRRPLRHSSGIGYWAGVLGLIALTWAVSMPLGNRWRVLCDYLASSSWRALLTSSSLHVSTGVCGFLMVLLHARFLPSARNHLALCAFVFLVFTVLAGAVLGALPKWLQRALSYAQVARDELQTILQDSPNLASPVGLSALSASYADYDALRGCLVQAREGGPISRVAYVFGALLASLRYVLPLRVRATHLAHATSHGSAQAEPDWLDWALRRHIWTGRVLLLLPEVARWPAQARYIHTVSAGLLLAVALLHVIAASWHR